MQLRPSHHKLFEKSSKDFKVTQSNDGSGFSLFIHDPAPSLFEEDNGLQTSWASSAKAEQIWCASSSGTKRFVYQSGGPMFQKTSKNVMNGCLLLQTGDGSYHAIDSTSTVGRVKCTHEEDDDAGRTQAVPGTMLVSTAKKERGWLLWDQGSTIELGDPRLAELHGHPCRVEQSATEGLLQIFWVCVPEIMGSHSDGHCGNWTFVQTVLHDPVQPWKYMDSILPANEPTRQLFRAIPDPMFKFTVSIDGSGEEGLYIRDPMPIWMRKQDRGASIWTSDANPNQLFCMNTQKQQHWIPVQKALQECDRLEFNGVGKHVCGSRNGYVLWHHGAAYDGTNKSAHPCSMGAKFSGDWGTLQHLWMCVEGGCWVEVPKCTSYPRLAGRFFAHKRLEDLKEVVPHDLHTISLCGEDSIAGSSQEQMNECTSKCLDLALTLYDACNRMNTSKSVGRLDKKSYGVHTEWVRPRMGSQERPSMTAGEDGLCLLVMSTCRVQADKPLVRLKWFSAEELVSVHGNYSRRELCMDFAAVMFRVCDNDLGPDQRITTYWMNYVAKTTTDGPSLLSDKGHSLVNEELLEELLGLPKGTQWREVERSIVGDSTGCRVTAPTCVAGRHLTGESFWADSVTASHSAEACMEQAAFWFSHCSNPIGEAVNADWYQSPARYAEKQPLKSIAIGQTFACLVHVPQCFTNHQLSIKPYQWASSLSAYAGSGTGCMRHAAKVWGECENPFLSPSTSVGTFWQTMNGIESIGHRSERGTVGWDKNGQRARIIVKTSFGSTVACRIMISTCLNRPEVAGAHWATSWAASRSEKLCRAYAFNQWLKCNNENSLDLGVRSGLVYHGNGGLLKTVVLTGSMGCMVQTFPKCMSKVKLYAGVGLTGKGKAQWYWANEENAHRSRVLCFNYGIRMTRSCFYSGTFIPESLKNASSLSGVMGGMTKLRVHWWTHNVLSMNEDQTLSLGRRWDGCWITPIKDGCRREMRLQWAGDWKAHHDWGKCKRYAVTIAKALEGKCTGRDWWLRAMWVNWDPKGMVAHHTVPWVEHKWVADSRDSTTLHMDESKIISKPTASIVRVRRFRTGTPSLSASQDLGVTESFAQKIEACLGCEMKLEWHNETQREHCENTQNRRLRLQAQFRIQGIFDKLFGLASTTKGPNCEPKKLMPKMIFREDSLVCLDIHRQVMGLHSQVQFQCHTDKHSAKECACKVAGDF